MVIMRSSGEDRSKDHAIPENFFVEIEYVGVIAWWGSTGNAPTPDELETLKRKLKSVESFANAVATAVLRDQLQDITNPHPSDAVDLDELATTVARKIVHDK